MKYEIGSNLAFVITILIISIVISILNLIASGAIK